jgi:hypothetical protein
MQNIHYPSTTANLHSCSLHNSSSTIKSCVQPMKSNVYTNARKRYAIVFKHPTYKSKPKINYAPMYIIKSLAKVPNGVHVVDKPKVIKRLT